MDDVVGIDAAEGVQDALVGGQVEVFAVPLFAGEVGDGAQQGCYRQLALAVDFDGELVFVAGLKFEPGTTGGYELGGVKSTASDGVLVGGEVDAGGAHELADDDALRTVNDEGTLAGHERKVTHEDVLLDDLSSFFVGEAGFDGERRGIGSVAVAAFVLGIFGFAEWFGRDDKFKFQVLAGEIFDGGDFAKEFAQAFLLEPFKGVKLDLDEARHGTDVGYTRERDTFGSRDGSASNCHG